jgi:hypothetical protein
MAVDDRVHSNDWRLKHEPESVRMYTRCVDGNYYRIPFLNDGLPDVIQGREIELMLKSVQEWGGSFPNRILNTYVKTLQLRINALYGEVRIMTTQKDNISKHWDRAVAQAATWKNTFVAPTEDYDSEGNTRIYNSIEEIEAELRDRSDDIYIDDAYHNGIEGLKELDKATARRMKRLESENDYYRNLSTKYQQMYVGAGHKIKELNGEIERLKQFEPITVNPSTVMDKTDITRRFATMDLV